MHSHHHHHHHHSDNSSERIGWAFFLNLGFTVIEFIGGWLTNSTAILADAVHDLGDSLSIGSAWLLNKYTKKDPDSKYTYGYRRFTMLGALVNGVVLVIGSIWVLAISIPRLAYPVMPVSEGMIVLSIFGMGVNGFAAYKLSSGKTLNEKILNWHLIEDVLGWFAVFVVAIILSFANVPILDPILSIAFTLFILFNVVKHLITTFSVFLQATPEPIHKQTVSEQLEEIDHVQEVHHLHCWSLDGEHHVLTAHIVMDELVSVKDILKVKESVNSVLSKYELEHTTIEIEFSGEGCRDA